ncbi:hypothetical protein LYSBPC_32040 [Lysinibacillus piscis]|uniref:Regulatory protein YycH-like domain-containing protein n=1 Tax=Lysinibacillus piscis TaxID=2518931 RepID=A0ABQ5NP36_9BACI|nr:two-component system regulatory protein YycI [Lysinibacillus sp. KH24]GLC90077.1 hypothetical protein LYSBPC_32040 [Lysinibacillus sp. KH24]
MDWNKTKTIFIAVFLILNIFLYMLYLNRYTEAQNVETQILGEKTIEARLKDDNITYGVLPSNIESATYISAKVHHFTDKDFTNNNQQVTIKDDVHAVVTFAEPLKLPNINTELSFTEFLKTNVYEGASYALWTIDHEERVAIFFQKANNRMFYYNKRGLLKVYWNAENEITMYEQTMVDNIEEMEQQENVLPPLQILQALYVKGILKQDSHITQVRLGYSALVYLTQTQVLVPTWEVQVKLSDGNVEEYFVNAVDGKMIEIQVDMQEEDLES